MNAITSIILSIALGIGVAAVVVAASYLIKADEAKTDAKLFDVIGNDWINALVAGIVVGLANYFAPVVIKISGLAWLAPVCLVVLIALTVIVAVWWHRKGGKILEAVPFIVLMVLIFLATLAAATATSALIVDLFWSKAIVVLPGLILIVVIAFILIDWLLFRRNHVDEPGSSDVTRDTAGIVAVVVIALIAAAILLHYGLAWGKGTNPTTTGTRTASAAETSWTHFYNLDLQNDGDDNNDFNFGPNPYKEGEAKDAKYYDADFRERLKWDPALAAASTAWLDANVGTRYLGEFYESCKGDWAKTMNEAKERFAADQSAFYKNLDAYFAFLDSAKKVEIRECRGVSDQMYMNPYTPSGVPDVIVMLTDDHSGYELVYTFVIKDNTFEVAYRLNCGYQPTDVAEVMGITPQNQPVVTTGGGSDNPSGPGKTDDPNNPGKTDEPNNPGKTDDPSNPGTTDEPNDPRYDKDPEDAPKKNTEPNDNPGPGENTNNPDDPNHSIKDRDDNSTSYPSYDAYRDDMDKLEEINQDQKVGGDPNTPSTPTPPDTTVDSNADEGTGNGGIDTPTPVSEPTHEADTGKEINSTPGKAWGGPTD